jgi:IS6 family transposase
VITLAVRWYLRYGLSYRDVEELLAKRGIVVDHVSVYRWVQRFTPLLIEAARPCRHVPGDRWFVDETYVKVAGRWVYLYRAIDQYGQVIDVLVSPKRDLAATRRFFTQALEHSARPTEVSTDRAPAYPRVLDELLPSACHVTEQYANNTVEADHGRLKSRPRSMRGLKRLRSTQVISTGHAFIQNLRRGYYELAVDLDTNHRLPASFTELARPFEQHTRRRRPCPPIAKRNSAHVGAPSSHSEYNSRGNHRLRWNYRQPADRHLARRWPVETRTRARGPSLESRITTRRDQPIDSEQDSMARPDVWDMYRAACFTTS